MYAHQGLPKMARSTNLVILKLNEQAIIQVKEQISMAKKMSSRWKAHPASPLKRDVYRQAGQTGRLATIFRTVR